ncbi:ribonuclease H-like domain-containing protein [Tanacetum coccineum]
MVTQNKDGTRKTTQCLNLHVSHISPIPKSPSLALFDPHRWDATYNEYNALIKNGTWVLVPRPSGANIVRCLWLFRHKFHADGSLSRYKARLVANGSSRQLVINCDETFIPVVKPATIRTVLRFMDPRYPHYVCRLQRSLYGLKQAPRAWFHRFVAYATRFGFYPNLGALNYSIGISVTRNTTWIFLSQKKYVMKLLKRAHMLSCNPTRTPIYTESKLGPKGIPISDPTLYRSLAGGLQYLTFTRHDLSYVVQQICLYMHDPQEPHLAALKRILHYVHDTLEFGLQLYASLGSSLVAYFDVDWVGCPATRRSTSGYCVFMGVNLLSWSAKRQYTLSRSSAEAEYRGVSNVVAEMAWLHNLLRELYTPLLTATLMYCHNVSDVYLSANPMQHQ